MDTMQPDSSSVRRDFIRKRLREQAMRGSVNGGTLAAPRLAGAGQSAVRRCLALTVRRAPCHGPCDAGHWAKARRSRILAKARRQISPRQATGAGRPAGPCARPLRCASAPRAGQGNQQAAFDPCVGIYRACTARRILNPGVPSPSGAWNTPRRIAAASSVICKLRTRIGTCACVGLPRSGPIPPRWDPCIPWAGGARCPCGSRCRFCHPAAPACGSWSPRTFAAPDPWP